MHVHISVHTEMHLTSMRCIFVHEWVGVYIYMCIGTCTGMYIDVCIGKCITSILFAYAVDNAVSHPVGNAIQRATAQHAPSGMRRAVYAERHTLSSMCLAMRRAAYAERHTLSSMR